MRVAWLNNREFHTQFPPKKLNDWQEGRTLISPSGRFYGHLQRHTLSQGVSLVSVCRPIRSYAHAWTSGIGQYKIMPVAISLLCSTVTKAGEEPCPTKI